MAQTLEDRSTKTPATNAPATRVPTGQPAKHGRDGVPGVMARFPDVESAREAIGALESRGIDGVDVTLIGDRAVAAEHVRTRAVPDRNVLRHAAKLVVRGAVLGTIGGLLASGIVVGIGLLVSADVRDHALAQVMIIIAFTFLGAIVGSFFSIEQGVGYSEAWYLTFQDIPDGEIWVAVFDRPDVARDVLTDRALEVRAPA
jgi:hypothetical protein